MGIISHFPGGGGGTGLPEFTYTGQYTLIDDGGGDWRIKFLTSGVLTFTKLGNAKGGIDLFLVGGGGASGCSYNISDWCGSGGGGYTLTKLGISVIKGTAYQITVGAGGAWPGVSNTQSRGGTTSAFGNNAEGGYSGKAINGGNGGSGGSGADSTTGGTDGGNGGSNNNGTGGTGQGTTTREFAESTGTLYASGGAYNANNGTNNVGNGADNTGNGGGGTNNNEKRTTGGSGIAIIRNLRLAITQQPQDLTVDGNEDAVFTVVAVGIGLTYQWQRRNSTTATWSNTTVTGNNTATLTVNKYSYSNGVQYRCIVTDKKQRQVTSDAATLTVTA